MSDTIQSLQDQLAQAKENLQLVQERKAQFILETDIPLDLIRDERRLEKQIAELRDRLSWLAEFPCPYRGLFAFREQDALFFFGRETFTTQLVQAVLAQSLVTVLGPSGSGKSSVVFAGLLPALRRQGNWLIADFRPGSDPFKALATALVPLLEPTLSSTDRLVEINKLSQALVKGQVALSDIISDILHKPSPTESSDHAALQKGGPPRFLLIGDQFEELYTLCPETDTRHAFLDCLLQTISHSPHPPISRSFFHLTLTLRADFMGQALAYRPFADALQNADLKLGPMTRQELTQAIVKPAHNVNIDFEPGLVERILDDVGTEPGQLPLLEFALTELWNHQKDRKLTHDGYSKIGEVGGALDDYVEAVYTSLNETEQHSAKQVLLKLVRSSPDTEDTRRLATRGEIEESNWNLVAKLASKRLVVTSVGEDGEDRVEIIHEALIRNWERLVKWLNEDREFRLWHSRLHSSLLLWKDNNRNRKALLQGIALAEAKQKADKHSEELSQEEKQFIRTSIEWSRRKQIAALGSALGLVGILAAVITLGITGQLNRFVYRPLSTEWVLVEAGEFTMGSSQKDLEEVWEICASCGVQNETPQHTVFLDAYEIGKYEITNKQYKQCVRAGICNKPTQNLYYNVIGYEDYPVVAIYWEDAQTFCEWNESNGGRLPTEAEWEKAARGSEDTRMYPWGDGKVDCLLANSGGCVGEPKPVGSYPNGVSPCGAMDMAGNVWEWVMDWYDEYVDEDMADNPTGPGSGEERVIRGGSFEDSAIEARTAFRRSYWPGWTYIDIGFRCVRDSQ